VFWGNDIVLKLFYYKFIRIKSSRVPKNREKTTTKNGKKLTKKRYQIIVMFCIFYDKNQWTRKRLKNFFYSTDWLIILKV
jgi:hypothetical protein